jgi:hypothetical protein
LSVLRTVGGEQVKKPIVNILYRNNGLVAVVDHRYYIKFGKSDKGYKEEKVFGATEEELNQRLRILLGGRF